jgi:predicted ABC-type ATPase
MINDATNGVPKSSDPTYHMLGGGPAAGKTSMEQKVIGDYKNKAVGVNSDNVKEQFPEYKASMPSRKEAAAYAHEESSYVAKRMQQAAFERGQDIVLDGTGDSSAAGLQGKIDKARANGYKVKGYYATVPTQVAVDRAKARGEKTGRIVPETVIRSTHKSVSQVFSTAVKGMDSVQLFDTSNGARIIAEGGKGRIIIRDSDAYDAFLAKGSE